MANRHTARDVFASSLLELLKTKDFRKITVKDIAGNGDYTTAAFYYHFDTKLDLVRYIWDRIISEGYTTEDLERFYSQFAIQGRTFLERGTPESYRNMIEDTQARAVILDVCSKYAIALVEEGLGEKPSDEDVMRIRMFHHAYLGLLDDCLSPHYDLPASTIIKLIDEDTPQIIKKARSAIKKRDK